MVRGPAGQIRQVSRNGVTVQRLPGGAIRAESPRPDGSRIVGFRNGGYVERTVVYNRTTINVRNYYVGGVRYQRFYNPYIFHGIAINVYVPARYYAPTFYGYVYAPWGAPVVYSWGWRGTPWYGYYGGYFTPYPVYASPSLWLTDYLIAQSLQDAYLQQQQQVAYGGYNNVGTAPISPEVKQQIAEEVRRQIALENAERQNTALNSIPDPASSGIARLMSDNATHVFVAAAPLNLMSSSGECAVTEGDVLETNGAAPPDGTSVDAVVVASKGQDCAKGSVVSVAFSDLQDMQNHMRETLDLGLAELQKKQGTGGLPAAPPSAAAPPVQAGFAAIAPPPDPSEATDVTRIVADSTQTEQDALSGGVPYESSGAPPTVTFGQTIDQVESIMGKPASIARTPTKTIYVYSGLKVIFENGKVSDIQ